MGIYGQFRKIKKRFSKNMILSKNIRASFDNKHTGMYPNALILDDKGDKEYMSFTVPNMVMNDRNILAVDYNRKYITAAYQRLIDTGYQVDIIDVSHMMSSVHYNPMDKKYIKSVSDIEDVVTCIIENTKSAAEACLTDSILKDSFNLLMLLYIYANQKMTEKTLHSADIILNDTEFDYIKNVIDFAKESPDSICAEKYKKAADILEVQIKRNAAGETDNAVVCYVKKILNYCVTPGIIRSITDSDNLTIGNFPAKRRALFFNIEQAHAGYAAALISMIYMQVYKSYRNYDLKNSSDYIRPITIYYNLKSKAYLRNFEDMETVYKTRNNKDVKNEDNGERIVRTKISWVFISDKDSSYVNFLNIVDYIVYFKFNENGALPLIEFLNLTAISKHVPKLKIKKHIPQNMDEMNEAVGYNDCLIWARKINYPIVSERATLENLIKERTQ